LAHRTLKGNQETSRALNRRLIVNHLRRFGEASRSDLVRATGLSGAAVTFVTAELIDEGLVAENPSRRPGTRRRPIDLNYTAQFAVGLKLMEHQLRAVLTDLSTRALKHLTLPVPSLDPDAVADTAAAATNSILEGTGIARSRILGIGLGLPGFIDVARGVCTRCHRLGWTEVPIARLIAERTEIPVWADNDVNAFALAEHLFGHGLRATSLVAVTIGRGVGAGIVLDGLLYHGYSGCAGEFGHVPIVEGGRTCECGRRGCLEAYVAEPSLLARMAELAPEHRGLKADDLAELGLAGDASACAILGEAGHFLGRGLAMLANLFNPEVLVIGGEGVRFGKPLFLAMQKEFDVLAVAPPSIIAIDDWDDDAWARGAAGLAIQRFFDFEAAQAASDRIRSGPKGSVATPP
jgi:predicted NBD/HSP70 family sugar kinase